MIGENPVQSEADQKQAEAPPLDPRLPGRPGHLPDRDRRARRRRPAGGRVVGRERGHGHELRAPRPARPQGARAAGRGPRRPLDHRGDRPPDGRRLGLDRPPRTPGTRSAQLSPVHAGMSYAAARGARRAPVAVLRREPPGRAVPPQPALGGSGAGQPRARSCRSTTTRRSTSSTDDYPIRLTTGRRLDSYNTGVQTGGYTSPLRRGESLDISPEDAEAYGLADGERVRVVSRRGQVEVPVRIDESLRPGPDVHDPPLPGRRRDEPPDDRRDRPEVRHRRVQGDRDPDREARGARPGLSRRSGRS